ncbi:hypothetical protein MHU86_19045 [Fragilaria crotonensis]|nr:hypothetical protein MHU86_19045 [Fragilaria crotonensis]
MVHENRAPLKAALPKQDITWCIHCSAYIIPFSIQCSQLLAKSSPASYRTIQFVHPSASRLHGARASSHSHVHRIRGSRPFGPQSDVRMASEIRRLVERDKRTGHDVVNGRTPTSIIRRIETASPDFSSSMSEATLDDEEINLMVRAISQNQDASSVCLGCHLPGHKLEDCNRFVDYIVAEGLAQRNPQLKAQIANSHKQFRSRLNSANTRGRPPPPTNRTMRRILEHEPAGVEVPATEDKDDDEDEDELVGFQQNSLRVTAAEEVDFEACFDVPSTNSITIPVADANPALPASETIHIDDVLPEPILLRRLAETYDRERQLVRACRQRIDGMHCQRSQASLCLPPSQSHQRPPL